MNFLVTGAAGFIGYHLTKKLLSLGYQVHGLDNINDYYNQDLKHYRISDLLKNPKFKFSMNSLSDDLDSIFLDEKFHAIIHLAAQAGVRYSIDNPRAYIDSNIVGFQSILDYAKKSDINHFIYASSSSVYGNSSKAPFSESENIKSPESLYAATKMSNELVAASYSNLFGMCCTGLRFFTVYGTYGRPDMAYFKFTKKIFNNDPLDIFNYGDLKRDFTHVSDICNGIIELIDKSPSITSDIKHHVFNIGNNSPVKLDKFVSLLESFTGKNITKNYLPMQKGDVYETFADISLIQKYTNFDPSVSIEDGLKEFVEWYKGHYKL